MLLPIRPVTRPKVLVGQTNGKLDPAILASIPGLAGGPLVRLVEPAATGWRALTAAAQAAGHILKATSAVDSYRPYEVQERTFLARYTTVPIVGASTRTWQGKTWYLKPGNAPAAAPGTSNHGWGLAIDTGEERDTDAQAESLDIPTLTWLVEHELDYGFSHEIQEENWHIRWFVGDTIPAAVAAFVEGDDMPTAKDVAEAVWNYTITSAGRTYTSNGSQIDAVVAARNLNEKSVPALAAQVNALTVKVDQILAKLGDGATPTGPVDLSAGALGEIRDVVDEELDEAFSAGADKDAP